MALVSAGARRQEVHKWLRLLSNHAWDVMQTGYENPLPRLMESDLQVRNFLTRSQVRELIDGSTYIGTAAMRAAAFTDTLREALADTASEETEGK